VKKLKNYLLRWTSINNPNITSYEQFNEADRCHIRIESNTIYQQKTLHLQYTTYDMQEGCDKVYKRNFPDVMLISDDTDHPYMYARIIGLFHAQVTNTSSNALVNEEAAIVQMAWVRWFKLDGLSTGAGFKGLRYPSVSFYDRSHPDAFGFIHPDEIIRAAHLIPRFTAGQTLEYMPSMSEAGSDGNIMEWKHFNVNVYV
jgi:hypothetical protein